MINNISITFNGEETDKDTQLCVAKKEKDCLLTEWLGEKDYTEIDLKEDTETEYDVFVAIYDTSQLDEVQISYKERFEEMRCQYVKLQKQYLDLLDSCLKNV